MKNWMLKAAGLFLVMTLFLAGALAETAGPVLLVELPEDVQLIEDVDFEDGDFIQTYQLSGGAYVQLLRYADFDMTIDDLIVSEWTTAADVQTLEGLEIGGHAASGVRFSCEQEGGEPVLVTLVLVEAGDSTLMYQAVYPRKLGETQIAASVEKMIDSMDVLMGETAGELPEVG